jgi:hypothetical protein
LLNISGLSQQTHKREQIRKNKEKRREDRREDRREERRFLVDFLKANKISDSAFRKSDY